MCSLMQAYDNLTITISHMTNLTSYPAEDDFNTTLAQSRDGAVGTVYVNSTPGFTLPVGETTGITVNPGQTNEQFGRIDWYNPTLNTFNVTSVSTNKGVWLPYTQQGHASGSVVRISNNYQFWEDIKTAVNSKLDSNGWNSVSAYDLDLPWSDWRHRNDAGVMKFRDNEQAEVTLKTLADAAGVNDKVKISNADTTAGYLTDKLTAGDGLSNTIVNPAGNEVLDIDIDLADTNVFVSTSSGASDSGKVARLNGSGIFDTSFLPTYPTFAKKWLIFTYDTSTASGTQIVTHNLWYTPQLIMFDTLRAWDYSFWTYDWTNNVCIYWDNSSTTANNSSTYCIRSDDSWTDFATGVVSAVSATTFTITWTKTGSANGTLNGKATIFSFS